MADDRQKHTQSQANADAMQAQLTNMVSGVEGMLTATCNSIMDKMKQLENKLEDMEKRYHELAKDAETALKEAETTDSKKVNGNANSADEPKQS